MAKRRPSYYDDYWPRYARTRPIDVEDGIKAKSKRGKFVENWWADRWIKALTRLMDSGRLSRGRSYARRGQVMEIDIKPGKISARVQGSRRTPYKVRIELRLLTNQQWEKVFDTLSTQAIFAAQLLNEEMPLEIEQIFDDTKIPLFPATRGDLQTDCSCPDWVNPCKHIAAVYYLLGERFDQDPFLLFYLRGRGKAEVVAALRERRIGEMDAEDAADTSDAIEAVEAIELEECLDRYWVMGPEIEELELKIAPPNVEMALLKRLGLPALPGLEASSFWKQMERVYDGVTKRALEAAFETHPQVDQSSTS